MGSDAKKAFNAAGRDELLWFDPATLTIVQNADSPLADADRLAAKVPEWLIRSVMQRGVKVPIIVRLNGKDEAGVPVVEVVDGRQRLRAVLEANRRIEAEGGEPIRIPGVRTRGDDSEILATMILTNVLRIAETPMARARKAARYLAGGRSPAEAAALFGVRVETIKQWLLLLECDGTVQGAVEAGELPASSAVTLAKLPRAEQRVALGRMRAAGTLRGASGVAAAEKVTGSGRKPSPESEVLAVPSRVWLKRLLAELEGSEVFKEGGFAASEATGAVAALKLVLEGAAPRDGTVRKAWLAVQRRFNRGRDREAVAAEE